MSEATPSLREQGIQALQEGNIDKAVDLLARAVMADDNDLDAKAVLGVAYSQKGLHAQAKRALQTTVERAPHNANFRYNLGVVLQRAGDQQGAAVAFRDTLQVDPKHVQAKQKLQEMGPAVHQLLATAPRPPDPVGVPTGVQQPSYGQPPMAPPPAPPGYGTPPGQPGPPQFNAPAPAPPIGGPPIGGPPIGGPPPAPGYGAPAAPGYGPPGAGGPLGAPPPGFGGGLNAPQGPPGTVQCPRCAQFSKPGLSCEWCSGPLSAPRATAPSGPVGLPVGGPVPMAPGSTEDEFNIKDGFSDWGAVLISPRAFFAEQAAYSNISGALGFLGAYAVVAWLINILGTVGTGGNFAGAAGGGCCGWLMMSAFMFVWGGIVHMCAKMFGGQAGFAGSFRAATFAAAPYLTLSIVGTLVGTMMMPKPPTRTEAPQRPAITASAQAEEPVLLAQAGGGVTTPGQSSSRNRAAAQALEKVFNAMAPAIIITLLGWVISGVYLVIGVSEIHGVGIGPAIGVVLVANLISWVILGIIGFAIGAAIAGAIAAAMGGAG